MLKNIKIKGFKMFKYLFLIISFISISFYSFAETIEIDLVNKHGIEIMDYSPKFAYKEIDEAFFWK